MLEWMRILSITLQLLMIVGCKLSQQYVTMQLYTVKNKNLAVQSVNQQRNCFYKMFTKESIV